MKYYKMACFSFCLLAVIGCKKKNDASDSFNTSFRAIVNNVSTTFTDLGNHYWSCAAYQDPHIRGTDTSLFSFELSLCENYKYDSIYCNSIFVNFLNLIPNDSLDSTDQTHDLFEHTFRQLLRVGDFPYTFNPYKKSGIVVCWYDHKGVEWVSGQVIESPFPPFPPDYSHNSFKVIYSQPVPPIPSSYTWGQEVVITFNCRVYNCYGDSLSIVNAQLSGIYSYKKRNSNLKNAEMQNAGMKDLKLGIGY
jgi:hypothetical protein